MCEFTEKERSSLDRGKPRVLDLGHAADARLNLVHKAASGSPYNFTTS